MPQQQETQNPAPAPQTRPSRAEHVHPEGASYCNSCRACRAADAERSKLEHRALKDEEVERTTFLVPEPVHDQEICRAYIAHKYPNALYIGTSLDLAQLTGWPDGEQIVVVRRDTWPRPPSSRFKRQKDAEDKWETVQVADELLIHECVESAPIDVRKSLAYIGGSGRFTKAQVDYMPLVRKLAEQMPVPYRIDMPRNLDREGKAINTDSVMRFVYA